MPQLACSTDFVMDAFLAVALFAGCAVGPDYHRPAALGGDAMPAAFGDGAVTNAGHWKTAEPSAHLPRGVWWEIYDDAELNRLELLAAANNQQIAVALANLEQAGAAAKVARADFSRRSMGPLRPPDNARAQIHRRPARRPE